MPTDSEMETSASKTALSLVRKGIRAFRTQGSELFRSSDYWRKLGSIRSQLAFNRRKASYEL